MVYLSSPVVYSMVYLSYPVRDHEAHRALLLPVLGTMRRIEPSFSLFWTHNEASSAPFLPVLDPNEAKSALRCSLFLWDNEAKSAPRCSLFLISNEAQSGARSPCFFWEDGAKSGPFSPAFLSLFRQFLTVLDSFEQLFPLLDLPVSPKEW